MIKNNNKKSFPHLSDGFVDENRWVYLSLIWMLRQPKKSLMVVIRQPRKFFAFICRHPNKFFFSTKYSLRVTKGKKNNSNFYRRLILKYKNSYIRKLDRRDDRPVILLLSTYPFINPTHGGQIRLKNIATMYECAGWRVHSVAIYDTKVDPQLTGPYDIYFDSQSPWRMYNGNDIPFITDLQSGKYATTDYVFDKIIKFLPNQLDVIHAEQPWMWPVVKKLATIDKYKNSILVNGTQNIELHLKQSIFDKYGINNPDVINEIDELELLACREADITVAVTEKDLAHFKRHTNGIGIMAPNGVSPWSASEDKLEEWRAKLPTGPWLLYVASAHPPNFTGFIECIGDSLACLPPDGRIVVAGSVSKHIYRVMSQTRFHSLNLSRLQLLFELSDEDLSAVKTLAPAYLLPLKDGGGSNLKTAEALYSNAIVVGSSHAFRGFEGYMHSQGVYICRTSVDFQNTIRTLSQGNFLNSFNRQNKDLLTWEFSLSELIKTIFELKCENDIKK
jgi:hypothetical protein